MKLTQGKLIETIRKKNQGWTTYQVRKIAGISVRRVNQVYGQYLISGQIPEIGIKNGRPKRPIEEWEMQTVKEAFEKYSVSASALMKLIERDYGKRINHNRIHVILLILGMAKTKGKKDIRKKDWIRYERRHSLTAVHIDWYHYAPMELWVFAVIDDASRKLLALVECNSPSTEASIEGMKEAMKHGRIKQCISDHGTQFIKQEEMDSRFKDFLAENNIKQILCRIKHPQSNGKVEKWFDLYRVHRKRFPTFEEFVEWYNNRPHGSLNLRRAETPEMAFWRKMPVEYYYGLAARFFKW